MLVVTGYVCLLVLHLHSSFNLLDFTDFINLYSYNREGLLNGGSCLSSVSQDDTENADRNLCPSKVRKSHSRNPRPP